MSKTILLLVSLTFAGASVASSAPTHKPLANATILIIRHAEKPDDGDGLTPAGIARSKAYVGYFKSLRVDGKPFPINHIFAAADTKKSRRPRLTVEPLGQKLNLPTDTRFKSGDYQDLAEDLKTHWYGKDILICWHHGKIPDLIAALGGPALFPGNKWPSQVYDEVVELTFDANGRPLRGADKILHEHLMPGDSR